MFGYRKQQAPAPSPAVIHRRHFGSTLVARDMADLGAAALGTVGAALPAAPAPRDDSLGAAAGCGIPLGEFAAFLRNCDRAVTRDEVRR